MIGLIGNSIEILSPPHPVAPRSDMDDPQTIRGLVALLGDLSAAVRQSAVEALIAIGGVTVARSVLPSLSSTRPSERNAACEILANLGHPAVGPLIESLDHPEDDVKLFAIETLTALRSPDCGHHLIRFLTDANLNLVTAAVIALGELRDVEVRSDLINALGRDTWIDCAIARSLSQIGGQESLEVLRSLIRHPEDCVVYSAIQGLSEMTDPISLSEFVPLMKHQNLLIMAGACEAAERCRTRSNNEIPTSPLSKSESVHDTASSRGR